MPTLHVTQIQRSLVSVLGALVLAVACVGAAAGPAAAQDVPAISA